MRRTLIIVGVVLAAVVLAAIVVEPGGDEPVAGSPATTAVAAPDFTAQRADVELHALQLPMGEWASGRHSSAYRSARPWHEWDSDDCSAGPLGDRGVTYDFLHACHRHDFGYRNLKRLERDFGRDTWNELDRRRVDDTFLVDMRSDCGPRTVFQRPTCYAWAQVYYLAVRLGGGFTQTAGE